jgi:Tfp pilus assembly protein PilV
MRTGTSLVEVMAAVAIFLIAVVGSSFLFVTGRAQLRQMEMRRIGMQLAASRLEQLKSGSYASIPAEDTVEQVSYGGSSYTRTTLATDYGKGQKQVLVRVVWGQEHSQHDVSLSTVIAMQ